MAQTVELSGGGSVSGSDFHSFVVVDPGHTYQLSNFEDDGSEDQTIKFIKKEVPTTADASAEQKLVTVQNGTTNETVLLMLIDRLTFLFNKLPDQYTERAIENIKLALSELESRTESRKESGVEGTQQPIPSNTTTTTPPQADGAIPGDDATLAPKAIDTDTPNDGSGAEQE